MTRCVKYGRIKKLHRTGERPFPQRHFDADAPVAFPEKGMVMSMEENGYRYSELLSRLREKIQSGEWEEGRKLPTERELSEEYGVSRATVRKALDILEQRGQVYRKQGKGTFVKNKPFDHKLSKSYSLREELRRRGIRCTVKILEFSLIYPDSEVCSRLNVTKERRVIRLRRLFYADMVPFALDTTYLPHDLFSEATPEQIDQNGLYNTFAKMGLSISRAVETIRGARLREDEARLLHIEPDVTVMQKSRVAYDGARAIEFSDGVVRSDFFSYTVELR